MTNYVLKITGRAESVSKVIDMLKDEEERQHSGFLRDIDEFDVIDIHTYIIGNSPKDTVGLLTFATPYEMPERNFSNLIAESPYLTFELENTEND